MKTIIVTGANSGLGLWTTKYLLDQDYKVIMACRNIEKTELAINTFQEFDKSKSYIIQQLDLGDLESISNFVSLLPKNEKIFGLDCNAGITYEGEFRYTKNGIEETFGVNHIGHFYLTSLLLKKFEIKKIVNISSVLHDPTNKAPFAKAVFKAVKELAYPKRNLDKAIEKQTQEFYCTSKLCNVLFTYELDRILKYKTLVNAYNPGLMPTTNLGKTGTFSNKIFSKILFAIGSLIGFATSPKKSAKYVVRLFSEENESGKYFDKQDSVKSSVDSYNERFAKELWLGTEELIHSILKT